MAGDWIKMRADLRTHPKVVRISSALRADRFRTVGGLHAVWCLFDAHSTDGFLEGYTLEAIDDLIGWPGFADAMTSVGWLQYDGDSVVLLPEFDTHNGASAKRRAQEADRKRIEREAKAAEEADRKASASDADKKRTRGEERREEQEKEISHLSVAPARQAEPPDCPHQEILALWAEVLPSMPQHLPHEWKGARADHLRVRWRETATLKRWEDKAAGLLYLRKLFAHIGRSAFLTGRARAKPGERPFVIELEWLVNPTNWAKVHEGKYHQDAA